MSDANRFESIRKFLRPGEEPLRRSRYIRVKEARGDFILTSQRVLFIQQKLLGTSVEEIPLERIDSVSHRTGLLMGAITLTRTNGRAAVFDEFHKKEIPDLVDAINAALNTAQLAGVDVAGLIRELKVLHDEGVLTADEFDRAKARYIGRGPDETHALLKTLNSLNELRKAGVLNQVEFDIKKRDLLATR